MSGSLDVILVEDGTEGVQYIRNWCQDRGWGCLTTDNPADLALYPWREHRPSQWESRPRNLAAVVVDLDLGRDRDGVIGGLRSIDAFRRHIAQTGIPIVLRTNDLKDDRDLAAVLGAELLLAGGEKRPQPGLPWWHRNAGDEDQMFDYIQACEEDPAADPTKFGALLIKPVTITHRDDDSEEHTWPLSKTFLNGGRWKEWVRMAEGDQAEDIIRYASKKAYDDMRRAVSALALLWQENTGLHTVADVLNDRNSDETWQRIQQVKSVRNISRQPHLGTVGAKYGRVLAHDGLRRLFHDAGLVKMTDYPRADTKVS